MQLVYDTVDMDDFLEDDPSDHTGGLGLDIASERVAARSLPPRRSLVGLPPRLVDVPSEPVSLEPLAPIAAQPRKRSGRPSWLFPAMALTTAVVLLGFGFVLSLSVALVAIASL